VAKVCRELARHVQFAATVEQIAEVNEKICEARPVAGTDAPTEALQAAEALLTDIVLLSEAHTGADLGSFREEVSGRRRAISPPLS
jgi:hypothetical protein